MSEPTNFCGIICEFNPLHFGHSEIITRAKSIAPVVCVMSGNFVQRGEPAILDKWSRTRLALQNGADLVLELPLPWACSGAENFAYGAVSILNSLGLSGTLLFGSECGNAVILEETAGILLSKRFAAMLTQELESQKNSFAATREKTLLLHFGKKYAEILQKPNNILGIEYIKAIKNLSADLKPLSIARLGAGHDTTALAGEFLSASEIRQHILEEKDISNILPQNTASLLTELISRGEAPHTIDSIERAILACLRQMTRSDFAALPDISEGLEHKLFTSIQKAKSLEEVYILTKSKRYSHARIRRLVMSAFLGLRSNLPKRPPYIRVLGMNQTGETLIRKAKLTLPLAVRPSDFKRLGDDALMLFELEANADNLYALSSPTISSCGNDYTQPIIKL
ncbi:tRNA(Met) cytidine acetate ligase [Scatolibacter rhodanostii]|uniref:tRNA(Met) cytidine acetate ligase n=1 Tax=Scatolibacter rhodanostii TaxID=2014781 RepID=UPI000C068BB7|nr:nucleotidyltransferase family protein [Scatolibacter rhodanostii]